MTSYSVGVPLNAGTMARMSQEEVIFWNDFLAQAMLIIDDLVAKGEPQPLEPPESLRVKYQRALEKYNGSIYCQVRQLEAIFNFSSGGKDSGRDLQTFLRGMV